VSNPDLWLTSQWADYATADYWNDSAVGEVPYLFMSNNWN